MDDRTIGARGAGDADVWHRFPVRVYWEDTDAGGIVYYANYLKFAERARTEMLRVVGIDQSRLMDDSGVTFTVRRCSVDYRAPARLDDLLEVATAISAVAGASVSMTQRIMRAESGLVRLVVDMACVGRSGRPVRLPNQVRSTLSEFVPTAIPKS